MSSTNVSVQPKSTAVPEEEFARQAEAYEGIDSSRITGPWRWVVIALTLLGILLTMNQVFFWGAFGMTLPTNSYLYLLIACFVPIVFIAFPAFPAKDGDDLESAPTRSGVPIYDIVLAAALAASAILFARQGATITKFGWEMVAPQWATVNSIVFWILIAEVLRRTAGWIVALIVLLFSLYPLIASFIPISILQGIEYDFPTLAQVHAMGSESIIGTPMQAAASILVGFLLFGTTLKFTGGADFFHDLSMSIFGKYRGGTAKVSLASSATMGMMSGSAVSNVLTTGPMTIPAMVKAGFSPKKAAAVEATASSGGSITPPIMGTAAFLMVSFAGVPYSQIIIAATIPAVLYFLGIFVQVDGYAARNGLIGTSKDKLPTLFGTLFNGWPFVIALGLLTVLVFVLPAETQIPFYTIAVLLLIAVLKPSIKFGFKEAEELIVEAGETIAKILGLIAGIGLLLGGLSATGVALSLSRDILALVGDHVILMLLAGALACFLLGMGLTISAAYVFLAIVMVPGLTALGLNPIAVHFFVIYWASVSYITPPVGLAAFAAAGIAKTSPMATCIEAMKLGAVKYILPFAFVLNPAIVAQGTTTQVLFAGVTSVIGVFTLGAVFSGWVPGVERKLNVLTSLILVAGAVLTFFPSPIYTVVGIGTILIGFAIARATGERASKKYEDDESYGN